MIALAPRLQAETSPEILSGDRFSPLNRRRLSGPALRTFLAICDLWELDEAKRLAVLGFPARSTFYNWVKTVSVHKEITLDVDVLTRISAIFGVHKALGILFPTEGAGIDWLRRQHQSIVFGTEPPIALLTSGTQDALLTVRRFLDAARGGLYMAPNEIDRDFVPYRDADLSLS